MYEAANVHCEDYTTANETQKIICTDEELRHITTEQGEPATESIAVDDITAIKRDTDMSQTGFKLLACAFGAFALVFSVISIQILLVGVVVTPLASGTYLAAILCWYGAVMMYRMEQGPLDVLEIKVNNDWYRFITPQGAPRLTIFCRCFPTTTEINPLLLGSSARRQVTALLC